VIIDGGVGPAQGSSYQRGRDSWESVLRHGAQDGPSPHTGFVAIASIAVKHPFAGSDAIVARAGELLTEIYPNEKLVVRQLGPQKLGIMKSLDRDGRVLRSAPESTQRLVGDDIIRPMLDAAVGRAIDESIAAAPSRGGTYGYHAQTDFTIWGLRTTRVPDILVNGRKRRGRPENIPEVSRPLNDVEASALATHRVRHAATDERKSDAGYEHFVRYNAAFRPTPDTQAPYIPGSLGWTRS
jgi:hypothetical protein